MLDSRTKEIGNQARFRRSSNILRFIAIRFLQCWKSGGLFSRIHYKRVGTLELAYGVAALICHPDVGSVKGHAKRGVPHAEVAEVSTVAGPQLGHGVAALIRYPDIDSVKGDAERAASRREIAEVRSVAGT